MSTMSLQWWMLLLAACGTDSAVLPDARFQLIDGSGTGIDAPPDARPPFPVTCFGMVTARNGQDKFAGAIAAGDAARLTYEYDPDLADENTADATRYSHDGISGAPTRWTIEIEGWTFQLVAASTCQLTVENVATDRFEFRCLGLEGSTTGGTPLPVTAAFITVSDSTGATFTSDMLPAGAVDLDPATATFSVAGSNWSVVGNFASCE